MKTPKLIKRYQITKDWDTPDGLYLEGDIIIKIAMDTGRECEFENEFGGWFMKYYCLHKGKEDKILVDDVKDRNFIKEINNYTKEITKEKMDKMGYTKDKEGGDILYAE